MTFDGLSHSKHSVPIDSDPAHEQGPGPMEIVLLGLCSCTATDVISILKKKREPFTGLTVSVISEQAAEPPKVFTLVKLTYRVSGEVSHKAVEDAVRLSETKYCPVVAMLSKTATIEVVIEYAD